MNRDPLHQAFQEGRISAHQSETRGFFVPPGTIASTADGWSLAVDHIEQLQAALQQASAASDPKLNQVVGLRFDLKHGYEVRLIEVDVLPVATQPKTPSPEIDTRAVPLAPATTIAGPAGSEPLGTAAQPGVDGNVCTPQRAHPLKMATPPEAKTTVVAQADTQALDLHPMAPDEHARARTVRAVQRKLKAAAKKRPSHEDLEEFIVNLPDPELGRKLICSAKPDWKATPTSLTDVSWEGIQGIAGPVDFRAQLLLEGVVVIADLTVASAVRVEVDRVLTPAFAVAVTQQTTQANKQTRMSFLGTVVGTRLSVCMGLGLKVRMLASVSRAMARGSPYFITVIDAFPWNEPPEKLLRFEELLVKEMRRKPPQGELWAADDVACEQAA